MSLPLLPSSWSGSGGDGPAAADLPGVVGPSPAAEAFAARWTTLTGSTAEVRLRLRVFRLDRVTLPMDVPGSFRVATLTDIELCSRWMASFLAEALPFERPMDGEHLARLVDEGRFGLWEDRGRPVSMVGQSAPASGVVRIGPVYTPPELRGRGYGSAATAEVSRRALDGGAFACTLNTDLANPTSNAIYQRIGYYPVADAISLVFEDKV